MAKIEVTCDYAGLECFGTVITGDWEGDRSVPGRSRDIEPYVDDIRVIANEEAGDIYDLLNSVVQDEIHNRLYESGMDWFA